MKPVNTKGSVLDTKVLQNVYVIVALQRAIFEKIQTLQNNNLQFCLAVNFEINIFLYWILYNIESWIR